MYLIICYKIINDIKNKVNIVYSNITNDKNYISKSKQNKIIFKRLNKPNKNNNL